MRHLLQKVSLLDVFPKVETDNQAKSEKGGVLTLLLGCFLFLLTLSELSDYRRLETHHQFVVDRDVVAPLQVNIDMTLAMPCPALLVHVYDVSGRRIHLTNNLKLIPAEFSIGTATKYKGVENPKYIHEMIKAASGKPYDTSVAVDMGACRVHGSLETNKIAANLHITSAGHGYYGTTHTDHAIMNFTHRIDEFSFGPLYPSLINPLDNSVEITESAFEVFQYFLSVVPTTYISEKNTALFTNQYAVTDSRRSLPSAMHGVPGVFFNYDIEPISVRIQQQRPSLLHFLVRLCGIIGGAFVTVGLVYRTLRFAATGGREAPHLYTSAQHLMRSV